MAGVGNIGNTPNRSTFTEVGANSIMPGQQGNMQIPVTGTREAVSDPRDLFTPKINNAEESKHFENSSKLKEFAGSQKKENLPLTPDMKEDITSNNSTTDKKPEFNPAQDQAKPAGTDTAAASPSSDKGTSKKPDDIIAEVVDEAKSGLQLPEDGEMTPESKAELQSKILNDSRISANANLLDMAKKHLGGM